MSKLTQILELDNSKWAINPLPIPYQVTKQYSTLVTLTKEDLIFYKSAVCTAQQIGIFLAEDNVVAFELCANLQKWKDGHEQSVEVTFSDKELAILDVSLSFVSLKLAYEGNRINTLLNLPKSNS